MLADQPRNGHSLPVRRSLRGLLLGLSIAVVVLVVGWSRRHAGAAGDPYVYVALGASDAVGIGAGAPADEGWVPRVHAGLPAATELVNLGISGATLRDVIAQQVPPALDAHPRWVTLWPGVNDLRAGVDLATFARQLETILSSFDGQIPAGRPLPTLVVLNIPDLRYLPAFEGRDVASLNAAVGSWNEAIARAVGRHHAVLVDLHDHWPELARHPEYISSDGFHPSTAGYRRISSLVLDALDQHVSSTVR